MGTCPPWTSGSAEAGRRDPGHNASDLVRWDQARHDEEPAHAVIGEMARLLRETRANMLSAGCTLVAIMIGIAQDARFAARTREAVMFHAFSIGVLLGTVCCWLTAVILLAVAGRPVLNALSELRWGTGSPLDPRAPWLTLPAIDEDPEQWTWIRAHLLLAAARLTRHRIQRADTWTYIAASCFMLWTVIIVTSL
jgi:hypothetical protein